MTVVNAPTTTGAGTHLARPEFQKKKNKKPPSASTVIIIIVVVVAVVKPRAKFVTGMMLCSNADDAWGGGAVFFAITGMISKRFCVTAKSPLKGSNGGRLVQPGECRAFTGRFAVGH